MYTFYTKLSIYSYGTMHKTELHSLLILTVTNNQNTHINLKQILENGRKKAGI